jgi:hypothetical protein
MAHPICEYLRPRIKEFVEAKAESLRWFSRQTGVDNTTIYRLVDGGQKTLSFANASRILKVIEPGSLKTTLAEFFPFETSELSSVEQEQVDALALPLALNIELYRVHAFATAKNVSRDDIKEKFGSDGLTKINSLLEKGILAEVEGRFVDNLKGMTYPSEEIAKSVSIHHFWMVPLEQPGSMLENFRGAVSIEGLLDIHNAAVEYRGRVHKALDEKKGEIVVAGSLIIGPTE